ncbi:hypothetical protein DEJ13_06305 [Curtobacterium sp. MCLR17_007]|uniref:hypothetical protein n=1 Tax=Curtobacterium sp. MCLR17_007 TaxID=2175648 RepID=UPI000DAA0BCC|nr:hypothetical protein [Curtobacterium sp. MCLR17_007]WIB61438.1 hypothetical protein DEJ13_06305 [Curtobacterium sp. MCLR17_007]
MADATTRTDAVDDDAATKAVVESEQEDLRSFVRGLTGDDVKTGGWFTKLIAHALTSYTTKVNAAYFQERYEGVPVDAIVEQRIKMAANYAALEGGLSAGAYTGAVATTIGTVGGASPLTVPAAVATVLVDVAFLTQLQLRLAYDISVLYRVPIDINDPDDLWKLIRVAFTIKGGELAKDGALKVVPAAVRPLVRAFIKGPALKAVKGLPFVGKFLLQRNIIKIGIPLVGVPLAVLLNRYTTLVAGRHARAVFRNDARILQMASSLSKSTKHPQLLLWVTWLMINADGKSSDDETQLMRHVVRTVRTDHDVVDSELAEVIELTQQDVWDRLDAEAGDMSDLIAAAEAVASVDGDFNARERRVLEELRQRFGKR